MKSALNLGQLIELLENRNPEDYLRFDFGGFSPCGLDSYRGYYTDLAICFERKYPNPVGAFLDELRGAVGKSFTGYKGGDFTMHRDSRVWVANHGETSDTGIVGISRHGGDGITVLSTRYRP